MGERPFKGAWVRDHSEEHGQLIGGYSTEEDVSLSIMLVSGNTQSRLRQDHLEGVSNS